MIQRKQHKVWYMLRFYYRNVIINREYLTTKMQLSSSCSMPGLTGHEHRKQYGIIN